MARSAHLVLFFVITMVLIWSSHAYYQNKLNPKRLCKGGPHDYPVRCGTHCPSTCENPRSRACIRMCKMNACECEPGYHRRRDGMCSTKAECERFEEEEEQDYDK